MNLPIEGLREEPQPKIDLRKKEFRHLSRHNPERDESVGHTVNLRQETRPDSVREAELRAQEILDDLDGWDGGQGSELNIPATLAPEGWEYQWRAQTVLGKDNRHHMLNLLRTGWRAVPASRHPWLMPAGYEGPIEVGGQILMEIPKVLAERRRDADKREALDQVMNSEKRLHETPANTAPREEFPDRLKMVRHEIMRPVGSQED